MKNILVHDDKNYIYRLIKFNLNNNYKIIKSSKNNFNKYKIESFDYIFFVFYNEFCIIDFIDYYKKNKKIIILFEDITHVEKIFEIKSIYYFINLNLMKGEIIRLIKESTHYDEFLYN